MASAASRNSTALADLVTQVGRAVRVVRSTSSRTRTSRTALLFMAASVTVLVGVYLIDPQREILPACRFHSLTGYSCPSCGLTRSLHALAHGDLRASLTFHPLGPGIALVMLGLNVLLTHAVLCKRRLTLRTGPVTRRVLLYLTVSFGVALWIGLWVARLHNEVSAASL